MAQHDLQYLQRHQINTDQWNRCVDEAANGLIYGYAWFLDHMAEQWDALVLGNYEAVLPLPWKKKYGIRYVYTPPFVQRLDVYGNHLTTERVQQFYQQACRHFPVIDLMVGAKALSAQALSSRKNLVIPLSYGYETIQARYTKECVKNIRKAENRGCTFQQSVPAQEVLSFFKKAYGHYSEHYSQQQLERLGRLVEAARSRDRVMEWGVADAQGANIFGALLFRCPRRIYYLAGAPTPAGREARATYYFIDQVLRNLAGSEQLFDFEGSDIPDVAAFYHRFGPTEETYHHLWNNRLPWPLKWMKRKPTGNT